MPETSQPTSTRQKILDAALELFSTDGYEAVSVERIAALVGIKAPSLYKHFKGKQDIFDALVAEMDRLHEEQVAQLQLDLNAADKDAARLAAMSEDELAATVLEMVRFVAGNRRFGAFWKMLTIEQYRRPDLAERYRDRYLQRYLAYHTKVFRSLMEAGALPTGDPEAMALQYFAPIVVAIGTLDRHPERAAEIEDLIRRHIHQFLAVYQTV